MNDNTTITQKLHALLCRHLDRDIVICEQGDNQYTVYASQEMVVAQISDELFFTLEKRPQLEFVILPEDALQEKKTELARTLKHRILKGVPPTDATSGNPVDQPAQTNSIKDADVVKQIRIMISPNVINTKIATAYNPPPDVSSETWEEEDDAEKVDNTPVSPPKATQPENLLLLDALTLHHLKKIAHKQHIAMIIHDESLIGLYGRKADLDFFGDAIRFYFSLKSVPAGLKFIETHDEHELAERQHQSDAQLISTEQDSYGNVIGATFRF